MRIPVRLAANPHDIIVEPGASARVGDVVEWPSTARKALVVTQARIADLHLAPVRTSLTAAGLDVHVVEVPDGESAKQVDVLAQLWADCAGLPLGRGDVVVAFGGGVVGDLAGFLAATWNRGVAVVQVPTTLLAQVDASIGGKTGINLAEGKNLIGAFHQPLAVVVDPDLLATLTDRERIAGLGEVVKYGFIRDPQILMLLEEDPAAARAGDPAVLNELVTRSASVKAEVVAADERESGERAHLNLGHTYGHAVEALTGYDSLLHGEAVSVGMAMALELGERIGVTPSGTRKRFEVVAEALGLPIRSPRLDRSAVWDTMARDKKAQDGVRFVLLDDIAKVTVMSVRTEDVDAAIDAIEEARA